MTTPSPQEPPAADPEGGEELAAPTGYCGRYQCTSPALNWHVGESMSSAIRIGRPVRRRLHGVVRSSSSTLAVVREQTTTRRARCSLDLQNVDRASDARGLPDHDDPSGLRGCGGSGVSHERRGDDNPLVVGYLR